LKFLLGT